jgi:hypothetical protein
MSQSRPIQQIRPGSGVGAQSPVANFNGNGGGYQPTNFAAFQQQNQVNQSLPDNRFIREAYA